VFESTGALVGKIKEPGSPELGTLDHRTYRRFPTAQEVNGTSKNLSDKGLGCSGVGDGARSDVEDPGNVAKLGDRKRPGRCEVIESGKLVRAVPGEPVEAERIDALAVDTDLELALLTKAGRDDDQPDGLEVPRPPH
jgi:hypothetical protein